MRMRNRFLGSIGLVILAVTFLLPAIKPVFASALLINSTGCIRLEVVDQDMSPVDGFAVTIHDLQPGQSGLPRVVYSGQNGHGVTVVTARPGAHNLQGNAYQYAGDPRVFSGMSQMFMQLEVFENPNCATAWFQVRVTQPGPESPLAVPASAGGQSYQIFLPATSVAANPQ